MKLLKFTLLFLSFNSVLITNAQKDTVYVNLKEALKHPQEVYKLDLSYTRLKKIPDEIALVAFGDDLVASMIEPSLTVYNQFPFNVGEEAAAILIDNIINKETFIPFTKLIKGELNIRQSSNKNLIS